MHNLDENNYEEGTYRQLQIKKINRTDYIEYANGPWNLQK